uniref:Uncharacterized protein n=1 Tax=Setaria digitata TaxID=48799 RepID=A0A915Q5A4_9BILA
MDGYNESDNDDNSNYDDSDNSDTAGDDDDDKQNGTKLRKVGQSHTMILYQFQVCQPYIRKLIFIRTCTHTSSRAGVYIYTRLYTWTIQNNAAAVILYNQLEQFEKSADDDDDDNDDDNDADDDANDDNEDDERPEMC